MPNWFFNTPFAANGDKTTIPLDVQPDGSVSYDQGFGFDYSRDQATDPLAKDVPRESFNQAMYDVTTNLRFWQVHGAPEYVSDQNNDGGNSQLIYRLGSMVTWRPTPADPYRTYISTIDDNDTSPEDVGVSWYEIPKGYAANLDTTSTDKIATPAYVTARLSTYSVSLPAASVTQAGISEYATNEETIAGTIPNRTVTVTGLAAAAAAGEWATPAASTTVAGRMRFATAPEVAALTIADAAVSPATLGSLIPSATTAALGRVRLATPAEATAQSLGTGVAVPPNALTGYARLNQNVSFNRVQSVEGYDVTSSAKVKRDLSANPYGLNDLIRIQTAVGYYKTDYVGDGRRRLFLIAEQLADIIPEAVTPGGADYNGEKVPTVNYDSLVPVLIEALKEERRLRMAGLRTALALSGAGLGLALCALLGG